MRSFIISLSLLAGVSLATMAEAQNARVRIVATGGTIAGEQAKAGEYGYKAGAFDVQQLIDAVPNLNKLAVISGEQVVKIGSQDMNDEVWLKLAKRTNAILNSSDFDGVVITHGTDTLEETSYFLSLVTHSDKPIVMVAAMRPATAISADGPGNLYNAVAAAASPGAHGRGVLIAMNDELDYARNATKTNATRVQTFASVNRGPAALVNTGTINWFQPLDKKYGRTSAFSVDQLTSLPRVDIIYAHPSMSVDLIDAAIKNGARGLVIAGVGAGNMTQPALDRLAAAAKAGVAVVRSTRTGSGIIYRNNEIDDDKMGFVASGELNPGKARVLLQLSLTKTNDVAEIQRYFNEY
jgi:L-asparaginase